MGEVSEVRRRFGARLKALREGRGLAQWQLGEAVGASQQAIAGYESGYREPDLAALLALAAALRCKPGKLLDGLQESAE